jgi:hypothetical protein
VDTSAPHIAANHTRQNKAIWEGGSRRRVTLKKLLADAMLDNAMLKEVASKKW